MRSSRRLVLSIIGLVVAVTLRANAASQTADEVARDSAALLGASWFICTFIADEAAGIPMGMAWNFRERRFQKDSLPTAGAFAILLDNEKYRAAVAEIVELKDGQKLYFFRDVEFSVFRGSKLVELQGSSVHKDEGIIAIIMISRLRAIDGRFTALLQLSEPGWLSTDTFASFVPGACTTTAEDTLKQVIEAARAKWLAEPVIIRPEAPPPPPPPSPEDKKSEP